jgi:hypothetical protein
MITANAGNDAGGIATYASVGADHGYSLLWILLPITISLGIVQEMCARMGAVTGKGLADLIRERFGVRWTAFVMLALLIANGGVTVSEFVGIAAATELFGCAISRCPSSPGRVVAGRQGLVQASGARLPADVACLSRLRSFRFFWLDRTGTWLPSLMVRPSQLEQAYLSPSGAGRHHDLLLMQVFVQSSVVEKGVTAENYAETTKMMCGREPFSQSVSCCSLSSRPQQPTPTRDTHRDRGDAALP